MNLSFASDLSGRLYLLGEAPHDLESPVVAYHVCQEFLGIGREDLGDSGDDLHYQAPDPFCDGKLHGLLGDLPEESADGLVRFEPLDV